MARRKWELVDEALRYELASKTDLEGMGISQIMDLLRSHYCKGKDILPQVDVMLCRNAKDFMDFSLDKPWRSEEMNRRFWSNLGWIAEEKVDGARLKVHVFSNGTVRMDTRRRSDVTYAFTERTDNFPHLKGIYEAVDKAGYSGVILDGEVYEPVKNIDTGSVVTDSCLNATVAIMNSAPEVAIALQKKYEWVRYYLFDIIDPRIPHKERLKMINHIATIARTVCGMDVRIPASVNFNKLEFFESLIAGGAEGVVLKLKSGLYEAGKRSKTQYKLKRFTDIDTFITGYKPGEHGNTGLVGALFVSIFKDEKEFEIGAVSSFNDDLRHEMTAPDGSLKDEFYGKVVTCRFQELTRTGRMRHAVFVGFRPDKNMHDCKGEELEQEN